MLRALTFDLDDTLWPVWPAIERAEAALHAWLREAAPATAARYDMAGLRALRMEVEARRPDRAHDLSALRLESLRLGLARSGEDPALAETAFEVFFARRQQVDLYADVLPALERLAARWPLFALSNGNADVRRIGLGHLFGGSLSAREFGVGKPDRRIFDEACRRIGVAAADVLHVGDDLHHDVHGALGAGLQAAWIHRDRPIPQDLPVAARALRDLEALAVALGV